MSLQHTSLPLVALVAALIATRLLAKTVKLALLAGFGLVVYVSLQHYY